MGLASWLWAVGYFILALKGSFKESLIYAYIYAQYRNHKSLIFLDIVKLCDVYNLSMLSASCMSIAVKVSRSNDADFLPPRRLAAFLL